MSASKITFEILSSSAGVELARNWLDYLEVSPLLRPTHWGESAFLRHPYSRSGLEAHLRGAADDAPLPVVKSVRELRWESEVPLPNLKPSWLRVDASPNRPLDELRTVLRGVTEFLDEADPEIAIVSIARRTGVRPESFGQTLLHPVQYWTHGPDEVWPRTCLGRRLVAMMGGPASIESIGATVTWTARGIAVVDLAPDILTADADFLEEQHDRVLRAFQSTGVFGMRQGHVSVPGERWTAR